MCTNSRFIVNKYDGRKYFVTCGHCDACKQEKADAHVKRILHEQMTNSCLPVFITLTYENKYIPYIKKSEVDLFLSNPLENDIILYRDNDIINNFTGLDLFGTSKEINKSLNTDFKFIRKKLNNGRYKLLDDKVSVVFLRDIQLFFKRLKINFFRAGYTGYFSYYYASEYGEKYNRGHFHILAFIDKEYYKRFQLLVNKSWPYADLLKFRKCGDCFRQSIEVAKNPAKYVASYLNCKSYLPSFLQVAKPFKPFTHFSNGFGCNLSEFSLPSLLSKVFDGNLDFTYTSVKNGISSVCVSRIPKYVLSRYFPKFKGYNKINADSLIGCCLRPSNIFRCSEYIEKYSVDEVNETYKLLCSLQKRVKSFGISLLDWSFAYPRVWSIYASEGIRNSFDDVRSVQDLFVHYDNIQSYFSGDIPNLFLDEIGLPSVVYSDPNTFPVRVARTNNLIKKYSESIKHHVIKNSFYEKSFAI